MSQSLEATAPDPALLPDEEYTLVHISELVHGKHNPRRETPKRTLKQSIEGSGINRPLIAWYDSDTEVYHITDGWQRYQAAIDAGWEVLPVRICDSCSEALEKAKLDSVGRREWGPYEWARFCRSIADGMQTEGESKMDIARRVADAADLTPKTVRRYLDVLSLPDVIHPLLIVGPEGSDKQWAHLKSYNDDVRKHKGLRLKIADRLAKRQSSEISNDRIIAIAANAVEFDEPQNAIEFIEKAVADERRLDIIQREVFAGSDHDQYLISPRVAIKLSDEKRRAVMEHCHQHRRQLSDIVSEAITSLADDLVENKGSYE